MGEYTELVFLFLAGLMGGAGGRPKQAAWPKTLRPCSVSPNHVLQFDAGPVTRHSGGKDLFQARFSASTRFRLAWLFGRPGLDKSDCRRALAHAWSPCMEESMRRWAASMQIKNRAASLLHTCPACLVCMSGRRNATGWLS